MEELVERLNCWSFQLTETNCALSYDLKQAANRLQSPEAVTDAYEHAAKVADYAVERAERDWRNPDKQDAVKQVGREIAEVIRQYARDAALLKVSPR